MDRYSKLIHKIIFRRYGLRRNLDLTLYPNIYKYIEDMFDDSYSFSESLRRYYLLYSGKFDDISLIVRKPLCPTCGNPVKFIGKLNKLTTVYCSNACSGKNEETIQKKIKSDKEKHNGKLGWNIIDNERVEKRKQSLIEKYGSYKKAVEHIDNRRKESIYNKYGVNSIMQVDSVKIKRNNSLKNTRKITKSKLEDKAYELLKEKYPDIIRQYTSDVYPFLCDFYVPSLDLYIEFQGSHFHNGRPYLNNERDNNELRLLKEKSETIKKRTGVSKTQYDMIIYTWTDLDVRKRNIAKENNLNFIEYWSIDDI